MRPVGDTSNWKDRDSYQGAFDAAQKSLSATHRYGILITIKYAPCLEHPKPSDQPPAADALRREETTGFLSRPAGLGLLVVVVSGPKE